MQAVEIVGDDVDGDFDGVANEMTIGDQTALAVYLAAQPRPTTLLELNSLGLLEPALTVDADRRDQPRPAGRSSEIGCATCHVPQPDDRQADLQRAEPERRLSRRCDVPGRTEHGRRGRRSAQSGHQFDLTQDQPDNVIRRPRRQHRRPARLASRRDSSGRAIVELFGDLKRHVMGPRLAEPVNEIAGDDVTPIPLDPRNRHTPDTFLTENLWGVGSTAPYMHDGRATTLAEAILEHSTRRGGRSERGEGVASGVPRALRSRQAGPDRVSREPRAVQDRGGRGRRDGCGDANRQDSSERRAAAAPIVSSR